MKVPSFSSAVFLGLLLVTSVARAVAPPTITSFSPATGPVGSTVIIDGTGFTPPFSVGFSGNVQAAGSFTSTEVTVTVPFGAQTGPITIVTSGGTVTTATDFTVGTAVTPTATLAVTDSTASVSAGTIGVFTVTLSSAPASTVLVAYKIGGTGVNGTDYAMLTGTVKIKAGKTSKVIRVIPQGNLGGSPKRTVKIVLEKGTGYTVGTTSPAKVKIVP